MRIFRYCIYYVFVANAPTNQDGTRVTRAPLDTKIAALCLGAGTGTAGHPVKAAEVPEPAGAEAKPESVAEKLADSKLGVSANLDKIDVSTNPSSNKSISQPDNNQALHQLTNQYTNKPTNITCICVCA